MKKGAKRVFIVVLALIFLAIGVVGLVLPILNGIVFIVLALLLLSLYSTTVRSWLETFKARMPKWRATIEKVEAKLSQIVGEL